MILISSLPLGKHSEGYFSQYSLTMGDGCTPIDCSTYFCFTSSDTSSDRGREVSLHTLAAKAEALIHKLFYKVASLDTSPQRQTSAPRILLLSTPVGKTSKLV